MRQSSGTQQREREKQKINYLFFTLFEKGKHLFEGNEFFSSLNAMQKSYKFVAEKTIERSPFV